MAVRHLRAIDDLYVTDPAEAAMYHAAPDSRIGQLIQAKAVFLAEINAMIQAEAIRLEADYAARVRSLDTARRDRTTRANRARIGPHHRGDSGAASDSKRPRSA